MIVRMWCGQKPYSVRGKLIRDTGNGVIIEDERGVRYFSRDVLEDDEPAPVRDDLFAPL